jgi:hypothetical protein
MQKASKMREVAAAKMKEAKGAAAKALKGAAAKAFKVWQPKTRSRCRVIALTLAKGLSTP